MKKNNYLFLLVIVFILKIIKICPSRPLPIIKLYYKLETTDGDPFIDTLDFQVTDPNAEYNGITITALTNASFTPILNTSVVFVGHRVPNTITGAFTKKIYDERFTVTDEANDEFSAAKVYGDQGAEFETTVPFVKYNIIYATGKYVGRKNATLFFDNDGTVFGNGQTFARRIELT